MNSKRKAVQDRIKLLEQHVGKAREYLESGKHAQWSGFRPLFVRKLKGGDELPPHKDWVKNVFLPSKKSALNRAEKLLERLDRQESTGKNRRRVGRLHQLPLGSEMPE